MYTTKQVAEMVVRMVEAGMELDHAAELAADSYAVNSDRLIEIVKHKLGLE